MAQYNQGYELQEERGANEESPTYRSKTDPRAFKLFRNLSNPENLRRGPDAGRLRLTDGNIEGTFARILGLSLFQLRDELQNDRLNAFTVLCAYVWRASKINEKISCITEFIREAFQKARELDDQQSPKKSLHGIPFSVKSNFDIEHRTVTLGLNKWTMHPAAEKNCSMVQFLMDQGAIPFCLTNVPQGLLSYVSSNPLYGTTKNPWDFDRTPGGSSGGEGALVAAGGSPFGIGSDLAGSLRIPAAFCGLVTLKPGQERLVVTGTKGGLPGKGRLGLSFGFYTRKVDEQEFLLNLIVGNPEYRLICPQSSPAPLRPLRDERRRRIGWFVDDGFNKVLPSNVTAVQELRKKLIREGHNVVEFNMVDVENEIQLNRNRPEEFLLAKMFFRNVMPDNGVYTNSLYSGEPSDKYMREFTWLLWFKVNMWALVSCLLFVVKRFSKRAAALGSARIENTSALRWNQERTDLFREKWIAYWRSLDIDALICPSFITPAQQFEFPARLAGGTFLTGLFNMLDVPAGIVPVGHVTLEDCLKANNESDFSTDSDKLFEYQRKVAKGSVGLPNAVQVVTLPNEEETCLEVMKIVERVSTDVQRLEWILPEGERREELNSQDCFRRVPLN